jgi:hypothetical protein
LSAFFFCSGDADYAQITTSISFSDTEIFGCIEFNITDDDVTESLESFTIRIEVETGEDIDTIVTILDRSGTTIAAMYPC